MQVTIHRGTQEIGGSCVHVTSGGTSILLDAGSPLGDTQSDVNLNNLNFDAVLVSHPHQDHYGLITKLDNKTPVYIGQIARQMIAAARTFMGYEQLDLKFKHFKAWEPFEIPPFKIKPYLMDHSSSDAFGFLIEVDGKSLFYSGDFRAHGSKEKAFETFLKKVPKDVDLLLMEGTMMGRVTEDYKKEDDVENEMVEVLKSESGPAFLICSGQHVDRLCKTFRVARRSGRIFVIDIYTAWILQILSENFDSTPHFSLNDIRVLAHGRTAKNHYLKIRGNPAFKDFIDEIYDCKNVIKEAKIAEDPSRYFIKNSRIDLLLDNLKPQSCSVIYSQWIGYLQEQYKPDSWKFTTLRDDPRVSFHKIHTSGHAFKKDLKRYVDAIKPKMLVPIHTERGGEYVEFFEPHQVKVVADRETFQV